MASHNIKVQVQRIEPIGKGRFKVKIAETDANINTLSHEGRELVATKALGRGRYIMRVLDDIIKVVPRKFVGTTA